MGPQPQPMGMKIDMESSLDLTLGDPRGAWFAVLFLAGIGVTLGGVIFAVVAFPWARRARYRNFGAMPRTGAVCGIGVAVLIGYIAWQTSFGEFYRVEVRDGEVRLHYHGPQRSYIIPQVEVEGIRRAMTLDKMKSWRIDLHAEGAVYHSANMSSGQMEEAWHQLAAFVKPLE